MTRSRLALVLAGTAVLATPAAAQESRMQLHGFGGFALPMADLGQVYYPLGGGAVGYRHFKSGVSFGAGLTYWLDRNLGLRVEGTYVGSKVVSPESNASWKKLFFGGDVVLRAVTEGGLNPYAYFGLGQARMAESGTARDANRANGRIGGGLNFAKEGGGLGFFAEAGLLIYDFEQTLFPFFDKVQTDLVLKAGVTFGM